MVLLWARSSGELSLLSLLSPLNVHIHESDVFWGVGGWGVMKRMINKFETSIYFCIEQVKVECTWRGANKEKQHSTTLI